MKTLFLFFTIGLLLTSCGSMEEKKFNVTMDEILVNSSEDSLTFSNGSISLKTEQDIQRIADEFCLTAKYKCKHSATFKPSFLLFYDSGDTLNVSLSFSAQNSYGVPDDLTAFGQYIGKTLIEESVRVY